MLLTTFVLLSAFGAGLWLIGHYFEYHGVATIGAVILIAVGGAASVTDVTVKDGEVIERDFQEFNESDGTTNPVNNATRITETRRAVSVSESLGSVESYLLGALTMVAGALLLVQNLNEAG